MFRTKNWIEINDQSRGNYNTNGEIRFRTIMLKSSLYDYSNAYIRVKGRIKITKEGGDIAGKQADEINKGVILKIKNCAQLIQVFKE